MEECAYGGSLMVRFSVVGGCAGGHTPIMQAAPRDANDPRGSGSSSSAWRSRYDRELAVPEVPFLERQLEEQFAAVHGGLLRGWARTRIGKQLVPHDDGLSPISGSSPRSTPT
jgi:hypothetical protein